FDALAQSCAVELEAIHPDGTVTCHSVSFSEPVTPDHVYNISDLTFRAEKFIEANRAESLILHGTTLVHPEGALEKNATLSITTLRAVDIPPLDGGMVNVTKHHAGFRFLPHGMNFTKEVQIRMPYDP